jgi:starch synthase
VDIILPKYDTTRFDKIKNLQLVYENLTVPYGGRWFENDVMQGTVEGINCYFIDTGWYKNFFNRGTIYGQKDDAERFAYFSKAALEFLYKTEKQPDCIHCHDWPTALVPVFLEETYRELGMEKTRVVYTIHNFEHQGTTHETVMVLMGLSASNIPDEAREMGHYGYVNVMKEAIIYSDFVTTVSPTYSKEVRFTDKGMGLQDILHSYQHKFVGIINGIDFEYWNPQTDPMIPYHYNSEDLMPKYSNKMALRKKTGPGGRILPDCGDGVASGMAERRGFDEARHLLLPDARRSGRTAGKQPRSDSYRGI